MGHGCDRKEENRVCKKAHAYRRECCCILRYCGEEIIDLHMGLSVPLKGPRDLLPANIYRLTCNSVFS